MDNQQNFNFFFLFLIKNFFVIVVVVVVDCWLVVVVVVVIVVVVKVTFKFNFLKVVIGNWEIRNGEWKKGQKNLIFNSFFLFFFCFYYSYYCIIWWPFVQEKESFFCTLLFWTMKAKGQKLRSDSCIWKNVFILLLQIIKLLGG